MPEPYLTRDQLEPFVGRRVEIEGSDRRGPFVLFGAIEGVTDRRTVMMNHRGLRMLHANADFTAIREVGDDE